MNTGQECGLRVDLSRVRSTTRAAFFLRHLLFPKRSGCTRGGGLLQLFPSVVSVRFVCGVLFLVDYINIRYCHRVRCSKVVLAQGVLAQGVENLTQPKSGVHTTAAPVFCEEGSFVFPTGAAVGQPLRGRKYTYPCEVCQKCSPSQVESPLIFPVAMCAGSVQWVCLPPRLCCMLVLHAWQSPNTLP